MHTTVLPGLYTWVFCVKEGTRSVGPASTQVCPVQGYRLAKLLLI